MLIYWLRLVCSNSSQVIIVITYFKSLTKITPTGTEQVLTLDSPPYAWVRVCVYARGFNHANSTVMRSAPVKQRDTVWSPVWHFWGFLPDIFILTSSRLVKLFNIGLGSAAVSAFKTLLPKNVPFASSDFCVCISCLALSTSACFLSFTRWLLGDSEDVGHVQAPNWSSRVQLPLSSSWRRLCRRLRRCPAVWVQHWTGARRVYAASTW